MGVGGQVGLNEGEKYLGGFSSPFLAKGSWLGYGLFATNNRLVGFKSVWARTIILAGPMIAALGGSIYLIQPLVQGSRLSAGQSILILGIPTIVGASIVMILTLKGLAIPLGESFEAVIRRKDFEVKKEFVRQIEMKPPQGLAVGYLTVTLKSGGAVRLVIAHKKIFQKTKQLIEAFYPEMGEVP